MVPGQYRRQYRDSAGAVPGTVLLQYWSSTRVVSVAVPGQYQGSTKAVPKQYQGSTEEVPEQYQGSTGPGPGPDRQSARCPALFPPPLTWEPGEGACPDQGVRPMAGGGLRE